MATKSIADSAYLNGTGRASCFLGEFPTPFDAFQDSVNENSNGQFSLAYEIIRKGHAAFHEHKLIKSPLHEREISKGIAFILGVSFARIDSDCWAGYLRTGPAPDQLM
jgi:hypothetical protein